MRDYICIVALMVSFGSLTMVVSGCEVKQNQTSTGSAPESITVNPAPPAEEEKDE